MRKLFFVLPMMLFLVVPAFAISYIHLDGASHLEVTPPCDVLLEADLSSPGNTVLIEVYLDVNGSGTIDDADEPLDYFGIIDGVPSIGWDDGDWLIPGDDDSTVNGRLEHTFFMEVFPSFVGGVNFIIRGTDEDASSATASLRVNEGEPVMEEPEPPCIRGRVSEEGTGEPIPDVFVLVEPVEGEDGSENIGVTNEDGVYVVNLDEPGDYTVGVLDPTGTHESSFEVDSVHLGTDSVITCDVEIARFTTFIHGNITVPPDYTSSFGEPSMFLMGVAMVSGTISFCFIESGGEYSIGVPSEASEYLFLNVGEGYTTDPEYYMVTVAGSDLFGYDFTVSLLPCVVSGRVALMDDSGIYGVDIEAESGAGGEFFSTSTDVEGSYKLRLAPGSYILRVTGIDGESGIDPESYSISVSDGDSLTGYDFAVTATLPSISGRVTLSDMTPIEGAYVIIKADDLPSEDGWRYVRSDASGGYSFDNVFFGDWHIGAYHPLYRERTPDHIDLWAGLGETYPDQDFVLSGTGISDAIINGIKRFALSCFPNPFNSSATLVFALGEPAFVDVSVYNLKGEKVTNVFSGNLPSGSHRFTWDAEDTPSGVYFLKASSGGKEISKKLVLLR
ncbi:T9SS type A sorting domain-containing protein [bacterium]|nr:T9SS type A sorting domain-containing protein [bacterium]